MGIRENFDSKKDAASDDINSWLAGTGALICAGIVVLLVAWLLFSLFWD